MLVDHPLFTRLSTIERGRVASMVDVVRVDPDTVLARQGLRPLEPFVINRGWARVELDGVALTTIERSQTVGLAAWADQVAYGATVVADTAMELYVVQPRSVRSFLEMVPWAASTVWSDFTPVAAHPPSAPRNLSR